MLGVAPSGYYEWLKQPLSNRAQEDARLLKLIRASFVASHGIYGAPRVFLDPREVGETSSKHRVARLMREHQLRALHGYRTRRMAVGKTSVLIPNLLKREFTVTPRNKAWVTDITYIRTWQGWLYLAVVMDLFSRKIVGWATAPTSHREVVLNAVLMAVRTRRPRGTVIHSDQGTQFGSDAWRRFCRSNHLEPSMSRKGNCWDNAVGRVLLRQLEEGAHQEADLQEPVARRGRRSRLRRGVLQFVTSPQPPRWREPGAVRNGSPKVQTRCPLNPGNSKLANHAVAPSLAGTATRRARHGATFVVDCGFERLAREIDPGQDGVCGRVARRKRVFDRFIQPVIAIHQVEIGSLQFGNLPSLRCSRVTGSVGSS